MEPAGPACVERRLAAIVAADFADYSRLIEAAEEGTLGRIEGNSGVAADRRNELRIGINLGGVIVEAGEGVNIAARVEAQANHGAFPMWSMAASVTLAVQQMLPGDIIPARRDPMRERR